MKPRNKIFTNLIYLVLVKLITFKCYVLAQSGSCSFERTRYTENICDRSNHLVHASEGVSGCHSATGSQCWCILIDNNNREYDGVMRIELNQRINRGNWIGERQFTPVKSNLKYRINSGFNYVVVRSYSSSEAGAIITSIKINNNEICRISNSVPENIFDLQERTDPVILSDGFSHHKYNYLTDCINRPEYTENSTWYCPNYSHQFMIEKRATLNNEVYWCININNDDGSFSSADNLQIAYSSDNKYFGYSPIDSYIDGGSPGSNFHLGNQRTVIAISDFNNQLPDLISVTINYLSICKYFEPTIKTYFPSIEPHPSPPTTTKMYPQIPELVMATEPNIDNTINLMENCGVKILPIPLIAFGATTQPGDWPWHAAIYKIQSKTTNRNYICGGTLISRKAIITAAHCVLEINLLVTPERLTVELGRHDRQYASVATQEYRVFEVKTHETYNLDTFENDIAILILANYVQVTRYVNFICLPNPNENLQSYIGTTVGWGRDETNKLQDELKVAMLPVVDKITCLTDNREFFGKYLTQTNFCAGAMNNVTVCRGDSGGGFVYKSNSRWFLGGITSVGVLSKTEGLDCAINQYALFTDVTKFVAWINQNS